MAEDLWEEVMHEASYAGVRIDVMLVHTSAGRELARHVYPRRDAANLEDQGAQPRVDAAKVVFFQRGPQDNHLERLAFFHELCDGEAHTFVHPLLGSYQAKIGQFEFDAAAEPRDYLVVDCTFEEHADEPAVYELGSGSPILSGVDEVAASAAALDSALADVAANTGVPVSSTVGAECLATVDSWQDPSTDLRSVQLQLVDLSNRIDAEVTRLELATDLASYPLLVALTDLHANVRKAAEVFAEQTPRIIELTLTVATPLLVIATRTYGADQAQARFDQLMGLNDIPNPMRIEAGTVLKAQAPDAPETTARSRR